jgi:hypothetical protein
MNDSSVKARLAIASGIRQRFDRRAHQERRAWRAVSTQRK